VLGAVIGAAGALAAARLLSRLVFGVSATDPLLVTSARSSPSRSCDARAGVSRVARRSRHGAARVARRET
jgi:hypothetical protein